MDDANMKTFTPFGNKMLEGEIGACDSDSEQTTNPAHDNSNKPATNSRLDPSSYSIAMFNHTKPYHRSILKNSVDPSFRISKKSTHVVFNLEKNMVCPIPTLYELEPDQIDSMWYHSLERQAMIQGALKIAADLSPTDDRARGLEHLIPDNGTRRLCARQRLYHRLFQEQSRQQQQQQQARQRMGGGSDHAVGGEDERLRAISRTVSQQSQEDATRRASMDEIAVLVPPHKQEQLRNLLGVTAVEEGIFTSFTETLRDIGWLGISPQ